jgi:hypothetical protein
MELDPLTMELDPNRNPPLKSPKKKTVGAAYTP